MWTTFRTHLARTICTVTTLGRAYIEIVADGSAFTESLRSQIEKPLQTELSKAAKAAGHQAGKDAGKEFGIGMGEGVKDDASTAEKRLGTALRPAAKAAGRVAGKDAGKQFGIGMGEGVKGDAAATEKRLTAGLRAPAKAAGRTAGEVGGKEFSSGMSRALRKSLPTISADGVNLGKGAGDGLSRGARRFKPVDAEVYNRNNILKRVIAVGEAAARTFAKATLDESKRSGKLIDFTQFEKDTVTEARKAAGHAFAALEAEAHKHGIKPEMDLKEAERVGGNAGHRIAVAEGAAILKGKNSITDALAKTDKDIVKRAEKVGENAGKGIERGVKKSLAGKALGLFKPLTSALGSLAGVGSVAGLSFAAIGTGAALLTPQVLSLAAALNALAGVAFVVPGVLGGLATAFIGIKLAVAGFGEVLKATTPEQFAKAVQDMGVKARKLAGELRDLRPAFLKIRQASQEAFAAELVGRVGGITAALSGPLRAGLAQIGAGFGRLVVGATNFLRSTQGLGLIKDLFGSGAEAVATFSRVLDALLHGFSDLIHAMRGDVTGLGDSIGKGAEKFSAWLTLISSGGQATAWFHQALDVLRDLGKLAGNLVDIFRSMFDASGESATSLLDTLILLTGGLSKFFASVAGQEALKSFFDLISQISSALSPIITALAGAIGQVAKPIANLITALAPGLADLFSALGPVLGVLGQALLPVAQAITTVLASLGDSLGPVVVAMIPLGKAVADVLVALSPLLPVLGKIVGAFAGALAPVIESLVPLINPLIGVITQLVDVLAPLWQQVGPQIASILAPAFKMVTDVMALLLPEILPLIPVIGQFAALFAEHLSKGLEIMLPLIVDLVASLVPLLPAITELLTNVLPLAASFSEMTLALAPLIVLVARFALFLLRWVVIKPYIKLLGEMSNTLKFFAGPVKAAADGIANFAGWLQKLDWGAIGAAIGNAFVTAWQAVVNFFEGIGKFFSDLPGKIAGLLSSGGDAAGNWLSSLGTSIVDFFKSLPDKLVALIGDLFDALLFAIGAGIALLVGVFILLPIKMVKILEDWIPKLIQFFLDLPGKIWDAIVGLTKTLEDFWDNIKNKVIESVTNFLNALVQFFTDLPGRIWNGIVSLAGTLRDFFDKIRDKVIESVTNFLSALVQFFIDLPGKILDAVGSLELKLLNFFLDLGKKAKDATSTFLDDIIKFFKDLPGNIADALSSLVDIVARPFNWLGEKLVKILNKIAEGFKEVIGKFPGGQDLANKIPTFVWNNFATGGVVPGTGNRDSVPAMLTPGEGVLTKRTTAALGGPRAIAELNRRHGGGTATGPRWIGGTQHFGIGGIVGGIGDALSSGWAKALGLSANILKILTDPAGFLADLIASIPGASSLADSTIGQAVMNLPVAAVQLAVDKITSMVDGVKGLYDKAGNLISGIGGALGFGDSDAHSLNFASAGNDQLGQWINRAVSFTGVPASWGPRLRVGIMRESGGNPFSINTTDINAQNGDPSRGLMQTIGATFEAYRSTSLPDNIYDPVANIVAGIRYIIARYGSIFNVQQFDPNRPPRGYVTGGFIAQPQLAMLHANEVVMPLNQPARVAELARATGADRMMGAGTVINAPITLTAPQSNPELVAYKVSTQIARLATAGI